MSHEKDDGMTDNKPILDKESANGLTWFSNIQCLPQNDMNVSEDIVYNSHSVRTGRKHFPEKFEKSVTEYLFYPEGSDFGKKCMIHDQFLSNLQSEEEIQLENVIGSKAKVGDPRGGLNVRYPGDKSYAAPEYSNNFHHEGSTRPTVSFSKSSKVSAVDTFIPIQNFPTKKSASYKQKDHERKISEEKEMVFELDNWSPAPPISASL